MLPYNVDIRERYSIGLEAGGVRLWLKARKDGFTTSLPVGLYVDVQTARQAAERILADPALEGRICASYNAVCLTIPPENATLYVEGDADAYRTQHGVECEYQASLPCGGKGWMRHPGLLF